MLKNNRIKWWHGVLLLLGLSVITIGIIAVFNIHTPPLSEQDTTSAISWVNAKNHIAETATIYGPVISTSYAISSRGQPTFLNVGKNYPDSGRFTVVIWGSDRRKFSTAPEILYNGKTISVHGLIELYQGSAEIIVSSPSQIQIQ